MNTENAIQIAFEGIDNFEEGIDILQEFYDYTSRPRICITYKHCSSEVSR